MEMHAVEKAALEDPFLADALEGYHLVPVNPAADISSLKKRLAERIDKKGTVKIIGTGIRRWVRIAALFILIISAGLATYLYVLKPNSNELVRAEKTVVKDSPPASAETSKPISPSDETKKKVSEPQRKEGLVSDKTVKRSDGLIREKESSTALKEGRKPKEDNDAIIPDNAVTAPLPGESAGKKAITGPPSKKTDTSANHPTVKTESDLEPAAAKSKKDNQPDQDKTLNEAVANRNFVSQAAAPNVFRGQVMDPDSNPLPFANVTNVQDHVGTYTDVKGNFVLLSPDSVLNVRIHSVGFESNVLQLKNNVSGNPVVLQQDSKNAETIVINSHKPDKDIKRRSNLVMEEPEPLDGWNNYDTYLANNINVPDDIKIKKAISGDVELSFSVNTAGEPVNIKVEKSVCKECDAEAIRLLKEGPKWRKKKNAARVKIAITF